MISAQPGHTGLHFATFPLSRKTGRAALTLLFQGASHVESVGPATVASRPQQSAVSQGPSRLACTRDCGGASAWNNQTDAEQVASFRAAQPSSAIWKPRPRRTKAEPVAAGNNASGKRGAPLTQPEANHVVAESDSRNRRDLLRRHGRVVCDL